MSTKICDLYGVNCSDINLAKIIVENTLSIKMIAHESSYHCGEYFRSSSVNTDDENFILQKNYDDWFKEWTEEEYSQYPFLLYADNTLRAKEIANFFDYTSEVTLIKKGG